MFALSQNVLIRQIEYIKLYGAIFIFSFLINFHLFRCTWIIGDDGKPKQFTQADQDRMITNLIEPMANDALRTICIAYKDYVPSNLCLPSS